MANKFTAGMTNFVEVLNQMWEAFAVGPYNALSLSGGALVGPVTSNSSISARVLVADSPGTVANSALLGLPSAGALNVDYEAVRMGAASIVGYANAGYFSWLTSSGNNSETKTGYTVRLRAWDSGTNTWTSDLFSATGDGRVYIPNLSAGSTDTSLQYHKISRGTAQGATILYIGRNAANPSVAVRASNGGDVFSQPVSVMHVGLNDVTGRGISTPGTVNAAGADYAEYLIKALLCGTIVPGQIVGIDVDGRLTDKWDRAIAFMVKSTDPCMVGGDRWGRHLGQRPAPVERVLGETDEEWAAHQAPGIAFDAALEAARQTVDRIAFAGQVPVNVLGATPGQYIVPVQEGDGIAGAAMHLADMSMVQYANAVGKVIAVEEDGRARIIVKAA